MRTSDEAIAAMEALVRKMAARADGRVFTSDDENEASRIVDLLPEPVHPDLLAAREICASTVFHPRVMQAEGARRGEYDSTPLMEAVRAGILYGRRVQ